MQKVRIYADEACSDNGSPVSKGGVGAVIEIERDDKIERYDFWSSRMSTTNNQMAIVGAVQTLSLIEEPSEVIFTSDSTYLINGITKWIHGWLKNGWVSKTKRKKVANREHWEALLVQVARHRVGWVWTRGHNGHPQNEYADKLAVSAAVSQSRSDGLVKSRFH